MGAILAGVEAALGGKKGWRAEVARSLAAQLDVEANASLARELRSLMESLDAQDVDKGGTPLGRLFERRGGAG